MISLARFRRSLRASAGASVIARCAAFTASRASAIVLSISIGGCSFRRRRRGTAGDRNALELAVEGFGVDCAMALPLATQVAWLCGRCVMLETCGVIMDATE